MYKCDTVCTIYTFAVILLNTALWDCALVKCGVFVYVLQELSTIPEHFHLGSVVESQKQSQQEPILSACGMSFPLSEISSQGEKAITFTHPPLCFIDLLTCTSHSCSSSMELVGGVNMYS